MKDQVYHIVKNIREAQHGLDDWSNGDPWKKLEDREKEAIVMYVVMQYRVAMQHIGNNDEKELEEVLLAIQKTQRLAAKVFDHIKYTERGSKLF